jgi:tryptophanyl-tRNA synthetase
MAAAAEQGVDAERKEKEEEEEQVVNPWEVSAGKGGIDYDKLVDQFGCQRIDDALVGRIARLTGRPPHCFLRRGLFFAHRY